MESYEALNLIQKIKDIREIKRISIEEMAEKLKISTRMYYKIERQQSEISLRRYFDICEILGLSCIDVMLFDKKKLFEKFIQVDEKQRLKEKLALLKERLALCQSVINAKDELIEILKQRIDMMSKLD